MLSTMFNCKDIQHTISSVCPEQANVYVKSTEELNKTPPAAPEWPSLLVSTKHPPVEGIACSTTTTPLAPLSSSSTASPCSASPLMEGVSMATSSAWAGGEGGGGGGGVGVGVEPGSTAVRSGVLAAGEGEAELPGSGVGERSERGDPDLLPPPPPPGTGEGCCWGGRSRSFSCSCWASRA